MSKYISIRTPLLRVTMTAALLAVPAIAFGQAGSTTGPTPGANPSGSTLTPSPTMPSATMPSPTLPSATMPSPTLPPTAMPGSTSAPSATPGSGGRSLPGVTTAPSASPSSATTDAASPRARMSEVIGSAIYNDRDEKIGEVDDVLAETTSGDRGPMAVVQVGGFLGIGGRLVTVPLRDLRWNAERERLVLPGASKEVLQSRPAFQYDAQRRG